MKVQATVLRALKDAAERYQVGLALLAAICQHESGLNPLAVGDLNCGVALGLGQLNLRGAGAPWLTHPHDLLNPNVNAGGAAAYLRDCCNAYPDDEARAISAYNQGIGGAARELWFQTNGEEYVQPVSAILHEIRRDGIEETWDAEVPEGLHEYGKTLYEVVRFYPKDFRQRKSR